MPKKTHRRRVRLQKSTRKNKWRLSKKQLGGAAASGMFSRKISIIKKKQDDYEKELLKEIIEKYKPDKDETKMKALMNILYAEYDIFKRNDPTSKRIFDKPDELDAIKKEEDTMIPPTLKDTKKGNAKIDEILNEELQYRLEPYLVDTVAEIHYDLKSKAGIKTVKTVETEKLAGWSMLLNKMRRRMELLKKPLWAETLLDATQQMFNEGYKKKADLEKYYSNMDGDKKGVRVWTSVRRKYDDDNKIMNPNFDNERKYSYASYVEHFDKNSHSDVNSMLNELFYNKELHEYDKNALAIIAKHKTDITNDDTSNPNHNPNPQTNTNPNPSTNPNANANTSNSNSPKPKP